MHAVARIGRTIELPQMMVFPGAERRPIGPICLVLLHGHQGSVAASVGRRIFFDWVRGLCIGRDGMGDRQRRLT